MLPNKPNEDVVRPVEDAVRYCTNCGTSLEEHTKFCPECGTAAALTREATTTGAVAHDELTIGGTAGQPGEPIANSAPPPPVPGTRIAPPGPPPTGPAAGVPTNQGAHEPPAALRGPAGPPPPSLGTRVVRTETAAGAPSGGPATPPVAAPPPPVPPGALPPPPPLVRAATPQPARVLPSRPATPHAPPPAAALSGGPYRGPYATWGTRAAGALIDQTIPFVLFLVLFAILGHVPVLNVLVFAAFLGSYFWFQWLNGLTGQSPGKALMGIRLVSADTGLPIGGPQGLVRALVAWALNIPCGIGYLISILFPLWDPRRQTLHDKAADAVVLANQDKRKFFDAFTP